MFAKKYHVIRYDFKRITAISSSQTEDYQFMHVEDLVTLMDSLHIKKAHIVGLFFGGDLSLLICWRISQTGCYRLFLASGKHPKVQRSQ